MSTVLTHVWHSCTIGGEAQVHFRRPGNWDATAIFSVSAEGSQFVRAYSLHQGYTEKRPMTLTDAEVAQLSAAIGQ
jgi:hypothetical protein